MSNQPHLWLIDSNYLYHFDQYLCALVSDVYYFNQVICDALSEYMIRVCSWLIVASYSLTSCDQKQFHSDLRCFKSLLQFDFQFHTILRDLSAFQHFDSFSHRSVCPNPQVKLYFFRFGLLRLPKWLPQLWNLILFTRPGHRSAQLRVGKAQCNW